MILTKTPLRISFLGGGSDFKEFFQKEVGYVLGTTINLSVYTAVLKHSELAESKFKLSYRINESVNDMNEIKHPLVREILKKYHLENTGLHISPLSDVPARTGLGSSSAFAVGLINAITSLHDNKLTEIELAKAAIEVERDILGEPGGWQDQCHSAFGGFNLISFSGTAFKKEFEVTDNEFIELLSEKLVLVAAGEPRDSGLEAQITSSKLPGNHGREIAREMALIAKQTAESLLTEVKPQEKVTLLANAMNQSWDLKQQISSTPSDDVIKTITLGRDSGAIASKLCGAGGSGFVLFVLGNVSKTNFIANFPNSRIQEICLEKLGSRVLPLGTQ